VFVTLDNDVVNGELGPVGNEPAAVDPAEQVEIDANVESTTGGEDKVVEGSLDVVQISPMHAVVDGLVLFC